MWNILRKKWSANRTTVNGWLAVPSAFSAECMARSGWDSLTVDLQHGVQDYQSMVACFQAMQPHGVAPVVRLPDNQSWLIGKALDAGALAVICPMINSRAEAERLVASCLYPPEGIRSNGPMRASIYWGQGDYQSTSNSELLIIAMIETAQAYENLEDILSVSRLDAVYVGPSDLSMSLGYEPKLDRNEPMFLDIYKTIVNTAHGAGKKAGIHTADAGYAREMIALGFDFVTVSSDATLLTKGSNAILQQVRT